MFAARSMRLVSWPVRPSLRTSASCRHPTSRGARTTAAAVPKAGDKVAVNYTGTLDDGTMFDTSLKEGREPLEFVLGSGQVVPAFETAIEGLEVGGTNKVRCEADQCYGEWSKDKVITVPKPDDLSDDMKPGAMVQLNTGAVATIKEVTESDVVLDANHELAGKALTFEVELMGVN